ncbi:MAG: hypothetical protein AMJ94_19965 [Deltaproteobacteria bacterium SM23_61]|nr:MAG: hypothetical protein AMJ94_19965 [Deltaproteobacteria bacterium SM23_61]
MEISVTEGSGEVLIHEVAGWHNRLEDGDFNVYSMRFAYVFHFGNFAGLQRQAFRPFGSETKIWRIGLQGQ